MNADARRVARHMVPYVAYPKNLEASKPGMQDINLNIPMGKPEAMMLDQFQSVSETMMPAFRQ